MHEYYLCRSSKFEHAQNAALVTAERLVKEYRSSDPFKGVVLENLVMIATKHKPNVERSLASFVDICQKKVRVCKMVVWIGCNKLFSQKDYVPGLLGMAIAYQVLKQTPRARNQLKRISKVKIAIAF